MRVEVFRERRVVCNWRSKAPRPFACTYAIPLSRQRPYAFVDVHASASSRMWRNRRVPFTYMSVNVKLEPSFAQVR